MKSRSDVLIVGGGPSGLLLARELAAGGLDVRIVEKKDEIGRSVLCTGIVGKNIFSEFGLADGSVRAEIGEVRLVSPGGNELVYRHPHAFALIVDRSLFDKELAGQAKALGATIELKTRVVDIAPARDGISVSARNGAGEPVEFRSRIAVLATGVHQGLQKKLGLGSAREYLYGAQVELETDAIDMTSIFFGRNTAPGGFAWVVPSGERRARVGLIASTHPKEHFARFFGALGLGGPDIAGQKPGFKAIAQGLVSRTYADRILVLGEAAGQVKTTTGGGIYFGLLCSRIASDVIRRALDAGDCSASGLAPYEAGWRKLLGREIRIGGAARKIMGGISDARLERLFDLARNDGMIPIVREKGNFDWHSGLILALVRRFPLSVLSQWFRRRSEDFETN